MYSVTNSVLSYSTDVSKMTLDLYQCNWEQKLAQSQEQYLLFSGPEQAVQDIIARPNPHEEWTQFPTLVWFRHMVPSPCFAVQWSKIWCWNSWGHLVLSFQLVISVSVWDFHPKLERSTSPSSICWGRYLYLSKVISQAGEFTSVSLYDCKELVKVILLDGGNRGLC